MINLSCATLSVEGFGDTNFDKTFVQMPEIGYKYVEFNLWYPSMLSPAALKLLKDRCAAASLKASSIQVNGGIGGDLMRDFTHKVWAMEAARRLGCRMVVTTGNTRGEGGGIEAIIASLKMLSPVAEDMDMLISLENHYNNNLETIDDYRHIFNEIPSSHVGLCIDTGHFDASNVDMDALIDEFHTRINHIHLKENRGKGAKEFTRFNEGTTDNHHIIKRMIEYGYSGYLVIEVSPEIGEHDGRPFTIQDIRLPYKIFSPYETGN